jgi:hypothetical protein
LTAYCSLTVLRDLRGDLRDALESDDDLADVRWYFCEFELQFPDLLSVVRVRGDLIG